MTAVSRGVSAPVGGLETTVPESVVPGPAVSEPSLATVAIRAR
jgi:hypothetical protein